MKLEDQVCSLKLAKRLKELGVKQDSYFFYEYYSDEAYRLGSPYDKTPEGRSFSNIEIAAFTVAELGDLLPNVINIIEKDECKAEFSNFKFVTYRHHILENEKLIPVWSLNYICDTTDECRNWIFDKLLLKPIHDKNEADARAQMLIYLLENKLVN